MGALLLALVTAILGGIAGAVVAVWSGRQERRFRREEDLSARVETAVGELIGAALSVHMMAQTAVAVVQAGWFTVSRLAPSAVDLTIAMAQTGERLSAAHSQLRTSGSEAVVFAADRVLDSVSLVTAALAGDKRQAAAEIEAALPDLSERIAALRALVRDDNGLPPLAIGEENGPESEGRGESLAAAALTSVRAR